VAAAPRTRRAELADVAADPVPTLDREDVPVVGKATVVSGDPGRGRSDEGSKKGEGEKSGALQWCSMTRSTMLYSFASSALMK
jgi:hypothetical protein